MRAITAQIGTFILSSGIQDLIEKSGRRPLVDARPLMMFNPDMRSANLLIPGLISILLTFSGTIAPVKNVGPVKAAPYKG